MLAHSSVFAPAQAQLALGNGGWADMSKWIKNVQTQSHPKGRKSALLASARSLVLTLTLASPGRWCDEDRVMAIVRGTTGTLVRHTLARRRALCLLFSRMSSCLMPPDRITEGMCRPHLQMRKWRLREAKHVPQNHLGAAFGLKVRGR